MSTIDLKSDLLRQIQETDDPSILQKIKDFLSILKSQAAVSPTFSEQERKMIQRGRQDIKEGRISSDEVVRAEINQWINQRR